MLLLAGLLGLLMPGAWAAQPKQVPHPKTLLTHIPAPLPGLEVHHTFPAFSHPQQVEAGDDVPVLLTVRNGYNATVLISYGAGTLASPLAPGVTLDYLQVQPFQKTIKADAEASFEYRYKLHERMPHRDFTIALTLFYNDLSSFLGHATTYFNQTVEVVEARQMVDTEALGIIVTLAAVTAFIVFMCWGSISETSLLKNYQKKQKRASAAKTRSEAPAKPELSEYLVQPSAGGSRRKREGKKSK